MKPTREEVTKQALDALNDLESLLNDAKRAYHNSQIWSQQGPDYDLGRTYSWLIEDGFNKIRALLQAQAVKADSVHVDKPLAESAVAPGECGSVPDGDKLDDLILGVSNTSFECGAFDMEADAKAIETYRKLHDVANAARDALRQYVMSGLGMQPPNTIGQPNEQNDAVQEGKQ